MTEKTEEELMGEWLDRVSFWPPVEAFGPNDHTSEDDDEKWPA